MAEILNTKTDGNGDLILEVSVKYNESLELKGNMKNIHIFSEEVIDIPTHISLRGKNESTKYFLIPKKLRNNLIYDTDVTCKKIDNDKKIIFIYIVDKNKSKQP